MNLTPRTRRGPTTSDRAMGLVWLALYGGFFIVGLVIVTYSWERELQPFLPVGLSILVLFILLWLGFPKVALGLTIMLALVGDIVTVSWFPFNKNMSSRESILFVSDSVSISPLEISLVLGTVFTAYRHFAATGRPFVKAPLNLPLIIFGAFLVFGLVTGLARGGDRQIALQEVRSLTYLPLLYLVIVTICRSMAVYRRMLVMALIGIIIHSLLSLSFLDVIDESVKDELESLVEHGAAIGMNLLFVVVLVSLAIVGMRPWVRLTLLAVSIPALWVYIVSQRRAAVLALLIAMSMFSIYLWWKQRSTFWKVVPISVLIVLGYVAAFWNSTGSAGFPAQAIKSVVAPGSASAADQSSDIYRAIERFNVSSTIKAEPLLGVGFGRPFYQPVRLPEIDFDLQEYVPHNTLLWLWIKMGFFAFATYLYTIARTVMLGSERLRSRTKPVDQVMLASAVLFVVMFTVFLYVEIGWEPRNVVLLALAMAICTAPLTDEPDADRTPTAARLDARRSRTGSAPLESSGAPAAGSTVTEQQPVQR